jgi:hypothetical protein
MNGTNGVSTKVKVKLEEPRPRRKAKVKARTGADVALQIQAFPIQGVKGTVTPHEGERELTFSAPAGGNVCAVAAGIVHFTSDKTHGLSAVLVVPAGQYVYTGLASQVGADGRQVKPDEVIGTTGGGPIVLSATDQTGPVDPWPLIQALSKAPGQPNEPLPNLEVVPVPPNPNRKRKAQPAPAPAPSPAPAPAPAPSPAPVQQAGMFSQLQAFAEQNPILVLAAVWYFTKPKGGGGGRRRRR